MDNMMDDTGSIVEAVVRKDKIPLEGEVVVGIPLSHRTDAAAAVAVAGLGSVQNCQEKETVVDSAQSRALVAVVSIVAGKGVASPASVFAFSGIERRTMIRVQPPEKNWIVPIRILLHPSLPHHH